jgi:hypothetical protein
MMTPEEVLIEAIANASHNGDSPALRLQSCAKLKESLHNLELYGVRWSAMAAQRDDGKPR